MAAICAGDLWSNGAEGTPVTISQDTCAFPVALWYLVLRCGTRLLSCALCSKEARTRCGRKDLHRLLRKESHASELSHQPQAASHLIPLATCPPAKVYTLQPVVTSKWSNKFETTQSDSRFTCNNFPFPKCRFSPDLSNGALIQFANTRHGVTTGGRRRDRDAMQGNGVSYNRLA